MAFLGWRSLTCLRGILFYYFIAIFLRLCHHCYNSLPKIVLVFVLVGKFENSALQFTLSKPMSQRQTMSSSGHGWSSSNAASNDWTRERTAQKQWFAPEAVIRFRSQLWNVNYLCSICIVYFCTATVSHSPRYRRQRRWRGGKLPRRVWAALCRFASLELCVLIMQINRFSVLFWLLCCCIVDRGGRKVWFLFVRAIFPRSDREAS